MTDHTDNFDGLEYLDSFERGLATLAERIDYRRVYEAFESRVDREASTIEITKRADRIAGVLAAHEITSHSGEAAMLARVDAMFPAPLYANYAVPAFVGELEKLGAPASITARVREMTGALPSA